MNTRDKRRLQELLERALTVFANYYEEDFDYEEIEKEAQGIIHDVIYPKEGYELYTANVPLSQLFKLARWWELFWEIEDDGTLTDVRRGRYQYEIEPGRLTEGDWITHLAKKGWVDLNSFIPAYFEALAKQGIKEITIKTSR